MKPTRSPHARRLVCLLAFTFAAFLAQGPSPSAFQVAVQTAVDQADTALLKTLSFRHLSVFSRGGRVTAVTGVSSNQQLYYMGSTGGGVWRTNDAGATWTNISDGFFEAGSIGAIAVAESN